MHLWKERDIKLHIKLKVVEEKKNLSKDLVKDANVEKTKLRFNTERRKSNNFPEKRWLKEDFRWFILIFHALRITSGNNIPGTISIDRREDEGSEE